MQSTRVIGPPFFAPSHKKGKPTNRYKDMKLGDLAGWRSETIPGVAPASPAVGGASTPNAANPVVASEAALPNMVSDNTATVPMAAPREYIQFRTSGIVRAKASTQATNSTDLHDLPL